MVIAVGDHQQRTSALCYELIGCTRLVAVFGPPLQPVLQHKSGLTFSELADYAHYYCHPWPQAENELDRQLERQGCSAGSNSAALTMPSYRRCCEQLR